MSQSRRVVYLSLFIAAGILLQLMESFFPVVMIVPGYKIGIANVASLFALYMFGIREMWIVALGRIVLAALMQGNIFSVPFLLSMSGGILSLVAMSIGFRCRLFSIYGVSVLGACFHNVGQVLAISWIYQQYFMRLFLPILLALSIVSGLCIALLSQNVYERLKGRI